MSVTQIGAALTATAAIPMIARALDKTAFASIPWSWRAAMAATYGLNLFAVSVPGRLDGSSVRIDGSRDWGSLFAPAPWAFAIWGMIYLLEMVLTVYAVFGSPNGGPAIALRNAAPYWITAHTLQALWCGLFRPKFKSSLWVPAIVLTLTGLALFQTHAALSHPSVGQETYMAINFLRIPVALHLGWMAAASLINWNSYLNMSNFPLWIQQIAAVSSAVTAAAVGTYVGWTTEDVWICLTVAWALAALGQQTFKEPLVKHVNKGSSAALASVEMVLSSLMVLVAGTITEKTMRLF